MSFSAPSSYAPRSSARRGLELAQRPSPKPVERTRAGVFLPFVLALLVLLGTTAYGILQPQNHVTPPAPGQRGALVWGDGIFATRSELSAWLYLHHASYATWARKHPAALRLVLRRAR